MDRYLYIEIDIRIVAIAMFVLTIDLISWRFNGSECIARYIFVRKYTLRETTFLFYRSAILFGQRMRRVLKVSEERLK